MLFSKILILISLVQLIASFSQYKPYYAYKQFQDQKHVMGKAFSYDNKLFALSTNQQPVRIFNIEPNMQQIKLINQAQVQQIKFSNDNSFIITQNSRDSIKTWNFATGNIISQNQNSQFKALSYDSTKVAVVDLNSFNTIKIKDPKNYNVLYGVLAGHADWVSSVDFSKDGKFIASSSYDNTIIIWNAQNYKMLKKLSLPTQMNYVSFSYDSKYLVTVPTTFKSSLTVWSTSDFGIVNSIKTNGYQAKFMKSGQGIIYTQDMKCLVIDSNNLQNTLQSIGINYELSIQKSDNDEYLAVQQYDETSGRYYLQIWKS